MFESILLLLVLATAALVCFLNGGSVLGWSLIVLVGFCSATKFVISPWRMRRREADFAERHRQDLVWRDYIARIRRQNILVRELDDLDGDEKLLKTDREAMQFLFRMTPGPRDGIRIAIDELDKAYKVCIARRKELEREIDLVSQP